ncbi:SphA family protein [Desulfosarcina cetonica]|uniref:SphA family protein n=1 Tax=Desulfosarcina cetonica TaxID=90730 RepID=UPI00155DA6CA|nr:transporter [Desulfosarcina cetonica]
MKRVAKRKGNLAMKRIHKFLVVGGMVCCAAILLICPMAHATENGGSAYVGGNEDFMAGALPPPGNYPILYNVYYTADKLMDDDGDEQPIDFDLNVYASVLRFIHVTEIKLLGADLAWHVIVPFIKQDLEIGVANFDESSSGIGDIEFSPLVLGWHFSKNMHLIGAVDVWAPVGSYDEKDPSSISRNYWTMAPILAPTYISDSGFEVSAKIQYLINFENSDTEYTSGNELVIDYLIGQHVGNWNFGVNGLIYKQITDDDQDGDTVDANKGQCISIGPAIQYNYKNMFFNAKAQFDTAVRNRPEGQKYWIKFMYAF